MALCANPAVIENRLANIRQRIKTNENDAILELPYRFKRQVYYTCFEILTNSDGNQPRLQGLEADAILIFGRHYTHEHLIQLQHFLVQLGVEIFYESTGSHSVSVLCRYDSDDLIDLMETLVDIENICPRVCNPLIHLCQRKGTKNVITRVKSLLKYGISSIRLDCSSNLSTRKIADDVERIFANFDDIVGEHLIDLNSNKDQPTLKRILETCQTTAHINIHSPCLYQKMIYNHQIDHVEESGLFRFNSGENSVYLPAFNEWENLRTAWHSPKMQHNPRQLCQLIFRYLDKHSHRRKECDRSPSSCEWCRVGHDVDNFLNQLIDSVEEMNPLFAAERIINYGSSAEKTNIFRACEFDRGLVLLNFRQSQSDPDQIVYTGNDPAYVTKLKEGDQPINSSSLLSFFVKAISGALDRVHNVNVFAPTVTFGETCVTVRFLYVGRHPLPAVKMSVDITIAVKALEQPVLVSIDWFMSDETEATILLVPDRRGYGNQWRLSYPTLERDMLLDAGDVVGRVYQFLKFLAALHHSKENLQREIPRKTSLSSYALKTCLFRYIRYQHQTPPWQPEDGLRHAIGILRQFPQNSCEMRSHFNKEIVVLTVTQSSKKAVTEIISMLNSMV